MNTYSRLPVPSKGNGLAQYLTEIRKFPMLTAQEEYQLGKQFETEGDVKAAHRLVTSHLRLAAKIAGEYRGYGLPLADLISEANVGLMHAVKRFKADKGFRLATYAMWWIRAQVQEFILRSWSLVKLGTTSSQKKLFFNLRKTMEQIGVIDSTTLNAQQIIKIAKKLNVSEKEVIQMHGRLSGQDSSLNISIASDDEAGMQKQDMLIDTSADYADQYEAEDENNYRRQLLNQSLAILQERERDIFISRKLREPSLTLEILSNKYGVSRERIRQIENAAMSKVSARIHELDREKQAN